MACKALRYRLAYANEVRMAEMEPGSRNPGPTRKPDINLRRSTAGRKANRQLSGR